MTEFRKLEIVESVSRIIDVCAGLKRGEQVLIVTDTAYDQSIVEVFATVSLNRGAEVVITNMIPRSRPGQAPPDSVARAMLGANVIFELTQQWIGASKARIDACAAGARFLTMTQMSYPMLRKNGPAAADFEGILPVGNLIKEKFTKAKRVRVMNRAGTDLVASIDGRMGRYLSGIGTGPGAYQAPPDIEAGVGPVEESVNGVIVVDGIVELLGLGVIRKPFRIEVQNGKIVKIVGEGEGKVYATALQELLDSCKDPSIYQIAEISLGLNPYSKMCDDALEGESVVGSAHVGIGDNMGYGGRNKAPGHFDVVLQDATMYLDDEAILKDGELKVARISR